MTEAPVNLMEVSVPYPVLLAEYQQRVAALTNENLMLRATVAHLRQTTVTQTAPGTPAGDAPLQPADAGG